VVEAGEKTIAAAVMAATMAAVTVLDRMVMEAVAVPIRPQSAQPVAGHGMLVAVSAYCPNISGYCVG